MTGLLVENSFLDSAKYREIYDQLAAAFACRRVDMQCATGADLLTQVTPDARRKPACDFAVFWDKDYYLAKNLEAEGVRVFNCAEAVRICDNKALTALCLAQDNIPQPQTVVAPKAFENIGYTKTEFIKTAGEQLGYPFVIKEVCGSFGWQVYLAHDEQEAVEIFQKIGGREAIMQAYIASSHGRDVRINVVGDRAVSAMLRHNEKDFRSNITGGGSMEAFTPPQSFLDLAVQATQSVGADFAGVDVLFGADGEPLICEVNASPHFKSTYDCTGVNMAEHIADYIIATMQA